MKEAMTQQLVNFAAVIIICVSLVKGEQSWGTPQLGSVVLIRDGQYSNLYTSGRVIVYGTSSTSSSSLWGNICRLNDFSTTVANVICHQLTYSGASSWSYAGVDNFGVDNRTAIFSSVSCSNSEYLTLFQCNASTVIPIGCNDNNDISVTCFNTRIWNSPSSGQIRLTGGNFTNEGLVEIYCNGVWGTVCDHTFTVTAGSVICKELGYSQYISRIHSTALTGITSQPIWLNSLSCSSTSTPCLSNCQGCPSSGVTSCTHIVDVTVICSSSSISSSSSNTVNTCPISSESEEGGGLSGGAIAGIVIGSLIAVGLVIGFITHLDKQKKRRAAQQVAAAQRAAPQPQRPQPQPAPSITPTETQQPPAAAAQSEPSESKPSPTLTRPPPPPYPGIVDTEEEKKIDHSEPTHYNPTAPSYPTSYPTTYNPSYPPINPYPSPPTNPEYPPPPTNQGYPLPTNPGYPPPTNPGYPPPTNPGYPPPSNPGYPLTANPGYPPTDPGYPPTVDSGPSTGYIPGYPPNERSEPPPFYNPAYPSGPPY